MASSQLGQSVGLIATIQAREQLSQEDALLSGMLAADRITTRNRVAFTQMAAARQADAAYANYLLSPANRDAYNAALAGTQTLQQNLASTEQAVAAGPAAASLPVSQAEWDQLTEKLLRDQFNGGVAIANGILAADHQASRSAWVKVGVTGGIVLLGLLITILVSTLIGRGIIRGLRGLERSARTLAEDQPAPRPGAVPVRHAGTAAVLVHVGRAGHRRPGRGGTSRHAAAGRQLPGHRLLRAPADPVHRGGELLRQRLGVRPGGRQDGAGSRSWPAGHPLRRTQPGVGQGGPDHAGRARADDDGRGTLSGIA